MRRLALLAVLLPLVAAVPALAQTGSPDLNPGIFAGGCGDSLASPLADLTPPELPSGEAAGAVQARPVASSYSTVPLSLDDMLATDHVVAVNPSGESEPAACGAIGGVASPSGALAIELSEQGSSGLSGIAYLAPGSATGQTDVSLFLAGLRPGQQQQQRADAGETASEEGENPTAEATETTLETYVSPTWGFALSYDPGVWSVGAAPTSEDNVDTIGLSAFGTDVLIGGFPYGGDALDCAADLVDGMTQEADVTASEPLLENGSPVAGGDAHDAYQAVKLTSTGVDGSTSEQAFYVRCIELLPGSSMVAIQQWSAPEVYGIVAGMREELLAGLVLP
jgi:hypothetical protein